MTRNLRQRQASRDEHGECRQCVFLGHGRRQAGEAVGSRPGEGPGVDGHGRAGVRDVNQACSRWSCTTSGVKPGHAHMATSASSCTKGYSPCRSTDAW